MLIYLRVLKESFVFAVSALRNNKLRTLLSLVGVTIGIFSIIAILAAVDSLKKEIEGTMSGLDSQTAIVSKFSFGPTDIPRWRWEQFPEITYDEFQYLERNFPYSAASTFTVSVPNESIKYEANQVDNVPVSAVTDDYYNIEELRLEEGRFFNASESHSGSHVAVVGYEVAIKLFGEPHLAIGKTIRLYGRKFT